MPVNSLKLMSKNHGIRCTVALGTPTCFQLNIFLSLRKKGFLQDTVDKEVPEFKQGLFP